MVRGFTLFESEATKMNECRKREANRTVLFLLWTSGLGFQAREKRDAFGSTPSFFGLFLWFFRLFLHSPSCSIGVPLPFSSLVLTCRQQTLHETESESRKNKFCSTSLLSHHRPALLFFV